MTRLPLRAPLSSTVSASALTGLLNAEQHELTGLYLRHAPAPRATPKPLRFSAPGSSLGSCGSVGLARERVGICACQRTGDAGLQKTRIRHGRRRTIARCRFYFFWYFFAGSSLLTVQMVFLWDAKYGTHAILSFSILFLKNNNAKKIHKRFTQPTDKVNFTELFPPRRIFFHSSIR